MPNLVETHSSRRTRGRRLCLAAAKWGSLAFSIALAAAWVLSHYFDVRCYRGAERNPLFTALATNDGGVYFDRAFTDASSAVLEQVRRGGGFREWWYKGPAWEIDLRGEPLSAVRAPAPWLPRIYRAACLHRCLDDCPTAETGKCPLQGVTFGGTELWLPYWCPLLAGLIVTGVFFWRDRPFPKGCCQHCGYDLTGNTTGRCPECGLEITGRNDRA